MYCRSFLVSQWIISIGRPVGGHITLSTYTFHTSPLFETLSTAEICVLSCKCHTEKEATTSKLIWSYNSPVKRKETTTKNSFGHVPRNLPAYSAEGFEQGGGVVGVRTQCYLASYWPTD